MIFDEYTVAPLQHGKVQIMFTEPVTTDWEMHVFMEYFSKKTRKKKIAIDYQLKPTVAINGLICNKKIWTKFLKNIHAEEGAEAFAKSMKGFTSVEDVEQYLQDIKQAGIEEQTRQLSERGSNYEQIK